MYPTRERATKTSKAQAAAQKRTRRSNATIDTLTTGPADILKAQTAFNRADRPYQRRLAQLGLDALSAPLFTDKSGTSRPAANDTERTAAYAHLVAFDDELAQLAEARDDAAAKLAYARNRLDSAMRATRLLAVREPR